MFSVYNGYRKVETNGKETYFAGANTADGFAGTYSDTADERELDRVYIIKGAAGTGKSTFMRRTAELCESEGYRVQYFLCGSDPFSLDCIVIDGRIAVLDGTSPHIRDMQYPGCASSVVDLSKFWDNAVLEKRREEIILSSAKKAAEYACAYRCLKNADLYDSERYIGARELFDFDKADSFIERFLRKYKIKSGTGGKLTERFSHALTMRGRWYIDLSEKRGIDIYTVTDTKAIAPLFLELLKAKAERYSLSATVYEMPVRRNITAVEFVQYGFAVVAGVTGENAKEINLKRFELVEERGTVAGRIKLAGRCEKEALDETENILKSAASYHFVLEEIYKSTMDFERLGEYNRVVSEEILARLKK